MTTDGAADIPAAGHPHESLSHPDKLAESQSGEIAVDLDADHCESCCHGHLAGMVADIIPVALPLSRHDFPIPRPQSADNLGQAPPTPPPNA